MRTQARPVQGVIRHSLDEALCLVLHLPHLNTLKSRFWDTGCLYCGGAVLLFWSSPPSGSRSPLGDAFSGLPSQRPLQGRHTRPFFIFRRRGSGGLSSFTGSPTASGTRDSRHSLCCCPEWPFWQSWRGSGRHLMQQHVWMKGTK